MRIMFTFLVLLALSACQSPAEKQAEQDKAEVSECTRLGFKPETDAFADCRLQLRTVAAQQMNARANAYNAVMRGGR